MKLVVDTNVLFSFFKKKSFTSELLFTPTLELISPEFSLRELQKYSGEIIRKSKINNKIFDALLFLLKEQIEFIPEHQYRDELKHALSVLKRVSPRKEVEEFLDDIDLFALALKEHCPIWSQEEFFKKQTIIEVFDTTTLAKYLKSHPW